MNLPTNVREVFLEATGLSRTRLKSGACNQKVADFISFGLCETLLEQKENPEQYNTMFAVGAKLDDNHMISVASPSFVFLFKVCIVYLS